MKHSRLAPYDWIDVNMSTTPLVSVVIPVHNGTDRLGEAIDSVLAQTWPNVEIIVVDDGSCDGGRTRAVLERYGSRIRAIHQPNEGVGAALNRGIKAVRRLSYNCL